MIHYPGTVACLFTSLRAEESSDLTNIVVCLLAKDLMKLLYICTCVFLSYDFLEYVHPSACDKKFSVQIDPYLVQRKYIFRIYISKLITTQSSSPYSRVRANLDGHSNCITDAACQLVVQNSRVVILRSNVLCVKLETRWRHESPETEIIYF